MHGQQNIKKILCVSSLMITEGSPNYRVTGTPDLLSSLLSSTLFSQTFGLCSSLIVRHEILLQAKPYVFYPLFCSVCQSRPEYERSWTQQQPTWLEINRWCLFTSLSIFQAPLSPLTHHTDNVTAPHGRPNVRSRLHSCLAQEDHEVHKGHVVALEGGGKLGYIADST
jgi:hypothetical protein